jgi:hypothetical protein
MNILCLGGAIQKPCRLLKPTLQAGSHLTEPTLRVNQLKEMLNTA